MRFEIGRSLIVFIWTNNRYREEVVRLFQGINRRSIRLLRARKVLGLCFLAVRRVGDLPDRFTVGLENLL